MIPRLAPWLVLCGMTAAGLSQEAVNRGAQIQSDFQKRVEDYVKLRKTAHEGLPKLKPTKSPDAILSHEHGLAHRIRQLRRQARQGDLFTPEVSAEFRRLIGITMQGTDAAQIGKSLHRAEPVHLKALRVNQSYPKQVPLQSTPPTLLLNLPKLPPEVEYRVVGRALVLRDVEANLIVDFIPDALPVRSNAP
jgi:hypothetical protein